MGVVGSADLGGCAQRLRDKAAQPVPECHREVITKGLGVNGGDADPANMRKVNIVALERREKLAQRGDLIRAAYSARDLLPVAPEIGERMGSSLVWLTISWYDGVA
jgi:hypothetical protein